MAFYLLKILVNLYIYILKNDRTSEIISDNKVSKNNKLINNTMISQKIRKIKDTEKTIIENASIKFKNTVYNFKTVKSSMTSTKYNIIVFKGKKIVEKFEDVAFGAVNKKIKDLMKTYNMRVRLNYAGRILEKQKIKKSVKKVSKKGKKVSK